MIFSGLQLIQLFGQILGKNNSGTVGLQSHSRKPESGSVVEKRPDIYLIIVDELAGSSSLQRYYGIDNSSLDSGLAEKGFQVLPHSRSNYYWTHFSVASLLNMDLLEVPGRKALVYDDYLSAMRLMQNNRLMNYLGNNDYSFYAYSSFMEKGLRPAVRTSFQPRLLTALKENTLPGKILKDIGFHFWESDPVKTLYSQQQQLEAYHTWVKEETLRSAGGTHKKPFMVYSHLFIAHEPFLHDSLGALRLPELQLRDTTRAQKVAAYGSNLQYVNRELSSFADSLLQRTNGAAIIIIAGDHGFRPEFDQGYGMQYFDNFCAVYLPDPIRRPLPDSTTLVNLFPSIFNTSLGQKLPLMPDSTIFLYDKVEK
ncbi:hypothetical protein FPE01S_02_05220 [Flavihumibacter petaseus NBRC 106054]|uniref:Sulfatase N-terminal domain-containing protein n=2 Tax=Flavihumibacter TaxID=1004301 RepID=A0A0E9N097_9BACT|nr:hypothetical protein FPE01S_02_05220 [Flavihumibacter petaseus NBRC 106054]